MVKLDDIFPSKYLKAADLNGKECTVTIVGVAVEQFDERSGKKVDKPVLTLKNATKAFVCNKTNANTIAKLYGDETDDWVGNDIALYPTLVDFAGDQYEAIRIKMPPKPKRAEPDKPSTEEPDDEIPF
jgi:hypothetical protein